MTDLPAKVMTPFDPNTLADQLRDKICIDLANLMPPEVWEQLLNAEIRRFTVERLIPTSSHYRERERTQSDLGSIVADILSAEAKSRVKAMLATDDWGQHWWNGANNDQIGAEVRKLVVENADVILSNVLASTIQEVINNLRRGMG